MLDDSYGFRADQLHPHTRLGGVDVCKLTYWKKMCAYHKHTRSMQGWFSMRDDLNRFDSKIKEQFFSDRTELDSGKS